MESNSFSVCIFRGEIENNKTEIPFRMVMDEVMTLKKKNRIRFLAWMFVFVLTTTHSFAVVDVSATSAIVMDAKTGRILYQKNIHQKMPIASTTKIMTALVALENSDPDEIVKIPREAVGVEGSSIYLGYDEKIKMRDLLYGLMLCSGNDAAVAIAVHVGGSVEKFVEMMNRKAQEIGAVNTNFMNPHGLHHDQHYSTAYDLALIARQALQQEEFKEIAKTKLWVAEREGYKHFYNKNRTVSEYEGGDGVKIGYTRVAGRCLVASATRNGMQLICVVLNDGNWFQDAYRLLDAAFERYKPYQVLQKDIGLKTVSVKNGEKAATKIVAAEDVQIPLTAEEMSKVNVVLETDEMIEAPVSRGQRVGKAKIYLDDTLLYTAELLAREDISVQPVEKKMMDWLKETLHFFGIQKNEKAPPAD